ncbi:SRPBCC family protein [Aquimarina sp. M1]
MKDSIRKEHIFKYSIDKVWNAISKEEEISAWFLPADFKAEVGYKYTFNATDEENCSQITGTILQSSPYTLVYTWMVAKTNVETTVTWKLEKTNEGTKLYLEHSGIANYSGDTAVTMFNSFNGGWDNCIIKISEYLTPEVYAR